MFSVGNPFLKCSNAPAARQGQKKSPKTAFTAAIAREMMDERIGRDDDIVKERTNENVWLIGQSCNYYQKTEKLIKEQNELRKKHGHRALRKDAVSSVAFIAKVPIEISSKADFNYDKFYRDHLEVVKILFNYQDNTKEQIKRCGEIDAAVIHMDEFIDTEKEIRAPHLHGFVRPYIWEFDKDTGETFKTLNAKKFLNQPFLDNFNKSYPAMMRERGWEVRDCIITEDIDEVSEKKKAKEKPHGRDGINYKADAEHQKEQLVIEIDSLNNKIKETNKQKEKAEEELKRINEENEKIKKQNKELEVQNQQQEKIIQEQKETIDYWEKEKHSLGERYNQLADQYNELVEHVKELIDQIKPLERLKSILNTIQAFPRQFFDFVNNLRDDYELTKDEEKDLETFMEFADDNKLSIDDVLSAVETIENSVEDLPTHPKVKTPRNEYER